MKLPRLFNRKIETKESATSSAFMMLAGKPVWSGRDYKAFADEGYRRNVVAYQAINKIADAVASVTWTAFRGEDELAEHPILSLIKKPNPQQNGAEYLRAKVGFLLISGNSYEEKVEINGRVAELYQLRPDRMTITPGPSGTPMEYCYKVGQAETRFPVYDDGYGAICHLRLFNPLDDFYGMSPIEAGSYAIDQHNEAMTWMQSLLQNSARPSGALKVEGDNTITDDQFNRLKSQLEDQYQGATNAGRPMLLEGGLSWEAMGLSPTDMQIIESKYSSARDVCLALGVPPQLLGIPGDNTYSNYAEARLAFWEDTVMPLLSMIAADWNNTLLEDGVELRPDLDKIPAIADKRRSLWSMADQSNDLTINERRALKGFGPIDGGDVLLVELNKIPLGDAAMVLDEGEKQDAFTAEKVGYGA